MSIFNFFKKQEYDFVELPMPDDSIYFFETIKYKSESYWTGAYPNPNLYGFQIQENSKWKPGLTEQQLEDFQKVLGFSFPTPLLNFYHVMNGLTKPGINLLGNSSKLPNFRPVFYSYPDDVDLIFELRDWIFETNDLDKENIRSKSISNIFPVYLHRFMMLPKTRYYLCMEMILFIGQIT